jgi:hypothetical protein
MFKRVFWWGAGFSAGLGSSFWVKRTVNRKVQRYVPDDVRTAVSTRARSAGRTVKAAVDEGRATMRQYQADAEARIDDDRRANLRAVPD